MLSVFSTAPSWVLISLWQAKKHLQFPNDQDMLGKIKHVFFCSFQSSTQCDTCNLYSANFTNQQWPSFINMDMNIFIRKSFTRVVFIKFQFFQRKKVHIQQELSLYKLRYKGTNVNLSSGFKFYNWVTENVCINGLFISTAYKLKEKNVKLVSLF